MMEITNFADWKMKKKLGDGGFGEVLLWKHKRTNQEIATKRCLRDRRHMHDDEIEKLKSRWSSEQQWLLNVNIEYIVRGIQLEDQPFVDYLNQQHGVWRPLPVIIMEYCNGGDLRSVLRKPENINGLCEFEVRQVMHDLRHAVEYLHTVVRIEHRDLKPDNIVINIVDNKKTYKLTDFGFCREVMDKTGVASIVGTQNYIAPEIVDTSKYTKTVDYWSMGIIAFELMCGVLPFIPHQKLFNKITTIKAKPPNCIAIEEHQIQNETFTFLTTIFKENLMSRPFELKMENWLRMALDKDYRTRGKKKDELQRPIGDLKIFTGLDDILRSKILTVFCLNTYQFISFEVTEDKSMPELLNEMELETCLAPSTFYLILPAGHPHRLITALSRPIDLYVDSWVNNVGDSDNPPVMLFLMSYKGDYNASDPKVSTLIKFFMEGAKLLPWTQQQIIAHTHFLLNNEQKHLKALLCGLHEYALQVDNEIFHFEENITSMKDEIFVLDGRVKQFQTMVEQAQIACQNLHSDFFRDWQIQAEKSSLNLRNMQGNVCVSVCKRYSSANRRIKEQATNIYFNDVSNKDIYELNKFRKWQQNPFDIETRCREAIYNCLEQRNKFLNSQHLSNVKRTIAGVHEEFRIICGIVRNACDYMRNFESELTKETLKFQTDLLEHSNLPTNSVTHINQQFSYLKMDSSDITPQNGDCPSLDDILNLPSTNDLLEDNRQQLLLFEMMFTDDTLPMTINID